MITVRNKTSKKLGQSFFNKTCAYIALKSQNLVNEFDIVDVKYWLLKKCENIGPFDSFESLYNYQVQNNLMNLKRLKTIKPI